MKKKLSIRLELLNELVRVPYSSTDQQVSLTYYYYEMIASLSVGFRLEVLCKNNIYKYIQRFDAKRLFTRKSLES